MAAPDNPECIYVFDASSWISIEGHPAQNKILYHLVQLIDEGRIKCPTEVWGELLKCDWVLAWIGGLRDKIVVSRPSPDYYPFVGKVFGDFPGMCAARGSKEKGDGYVVAMAAHGNATSNPTEWVVVAAETLAQRPRRKIPHACAHYDIDCLGLMDMLKREFPDESW